MELNHKNIMCYPYTIPCYPVVFFFAWLELWVQFKILTFTTKNLMHFI